MTAGRKVPSIALIVPAIIGFLLAAITEDGATMINIAVFGATVSYVLMMLSHIVLRRREPDLERAVPDAGRHRHLRRRPRARALAVVATFLVDVQAAIITLGVYAPRRCTSSSTRATTWCPPRRRRSSRRSRRAESELRGA